MKLFNFNWEEVVKYLKELANDDAMLERIAEKQIKKIVKETHPRNHKEFIRTNKERLEEIKLKVTEKYKKEIQQRINELFPS